MKVQQVRENVETLSNEFEVSALYSARNCVQEAIVCNPADLDNGTTSSESFIKINKANDNVIKAVNELKNVVELEMGRCSVSAAIFNAAKEKGIVASDGSFFHSIDELDTICNEIGKLHSKIVEIFISMKDSLFEVKQNLKLDQLQFSSGCVESAGKNPYHRSLVKKEFENRLFRDFKTLLP